MRWPKSFEMGPVHPGHNGGLAYRQSSLSAAGSDFVCFLSPLAEVTALRRRDLYNARPLKLWPT